MVGIDLINGGTKYVENVELVCVPKLRSAFGASNESNRVVSSFFGGLSVRQ